MGFLWISVSLLALCLGFGVILIDGSGDRSKAEILDSEVSGGGGGRGEGSKKRWGTTRPRSPIGHDHRERSNTPELAKKSPKDYGFMVDLPLEYMGAEVVVGEEVLYDDGTTELRGIMDVGLGQEKILVIEKFGRDGANRYSAIFSGEKLNVYVHPSHLSSIKYSLSLLGVHVLENRYGATVLNLVLREEKVSDFFKIQLMVEHIVRSRGEVYLATTTKWDSHGSGDRISPGTSGSRE